jgi:hypothetical protein
MDYWFLFDRIIILYAEQYLSRKAAMKSKHTPSVNVTNVNKRLNIQAASKQ